MADRPVIALTGDPLPARSDLVVVGAGIVGLATAAKLLEASPGTSVTVIEKEHCLAAHQTGRNSGVIHSGIYYQPGSAKARTCRTGRAELLRFCAEHGIAHEVCGKVIVAVDDAELPALARLEDRAAANGITTERLDRAGLAEREPHTRGVAALLVADAGIVDFVQMCEALVGSIRSAGGSVVPGAAVTAMAELGDEVRIETTAGPIRARAAVNCAGLHSDRVAAAAGAPGEARILPFRGEYYELRPQARHLVRHLVYPVPDPRFPFLGVHLTRMIGGSVHAGPNAVVALAREGYRWRDVTPVDAWEVVASRSSWRLARRYWRQGAGELHRSVSKRAFVKALQRLVPEVQGEDLERSPAGVRAQAVGPDGALLDDFAWRETPRVVHVVNAPSPAATASLAIGAEIAGRAALRLG
jgi:(S)-2-hydroxyglutarate dehydrogenase